MAHNGEYIVDSYLKINKLVHSKLPIYCISEHFLIYEEWFDKFQDEINIELAENGTDREMDFDIEREFENRYVMYLNTYYQNF